MGRLKAAAAPRQHVYRRSPLLAKPGKRTRQEALPSALHMGICVGLSLLVFAIINICVSELLGPSNPFVKLVQSGTMMAMLTVTVLGTPNLGNSFTKAAQRIAGVMIGGWLFYALYAANQQWWFLVICLSVWGFVLVALSFALSGREFLFPVALVTSFIVVCNFNSVKQAMVMTLVKTVAFAGAIVLYTIMSLLMFPLTATQQLLTNLAAALQDIEHLADILLVRGLTATQDAAQLSSSERTADAAVQNLDAAAATDGHIQPKVSVGNGATPPEAAGAKVAAAAAGSKGSKKGKKPPAAQDSLAVSLAANANHKLQLVQQLLRMTSKERYIGTIGSYRCFLPTVFLKRGVLPEEEVLAVVVNAGQVLRVLMTVMADFGTAPLGQRLPPFVVEGGGTVATLALMQQGVAALQDITAALPVSGASSHPVPISNLQDYAEKLQQIVAATVTARATAPAGADMAAADASGAGTGMPVSSSPSNPSTASDATPAGRWQKAAVAAAGIQLPQQRAQQLAMAFGALLSESVRSEEKQVARWCSVLVLSRQLGRSIAGLNDSVNDLLAKLPWVQAG